MTIPARSCSPLYKKTRELFRGLILFSDARAIDLTIASGLQ
jgi:hypothetical protein